MKEKKGRVRSFLCFCQPVTDDDKTNETPAKDSPGADGARKKRSRRLMSKIVKFMSFKSNSSSREAKLPKDRTGSRLGEALDSSENQSSAFKSSGKNSDPKNFSSSSSSSSCSLFSSSSCRCCSSAAPSSSSMAAPTTRVRRKKTFMPPPATRNRGYATGLTLVLLSLFAMLFCGRLCAILWTATWLCLVPRRRRVPPEFSGAQASASTKSRPRVEYSEEEKRRVVMEGFLQRSRKLV